MISMNRIFFLAIFPLLIAARFQKQLSNKVSFTYDELASFRKDIKPLLDVIASGEGDYTSVNRGRAGDSRGDWAKKHIGKSITEMTISELRSHQGGRNSDCWHEGKKGSANLFAVGRYQLIPCTLKYATENIEELDLNSLYSPDVQDTFGVFLLLVKRPVVRDYLAGINNDHKEAGQELAKEFASVPIQYSNGRCRRGQSYYCGDKAGNKAHISLNDIDKALKQTRRTLKRKGDLRDIITERERLRRKIRRWWNNLFSNEASLVEPSPEPKPIEPPPPTEVPVEPNTLAPQAPVHNRPDPLPSSTPSVDSTEEDTSTQDNEEDEFLELEEDIVPRIVPEEE